jgi:hypothetical protein
MAKWNTAIHASRRLLAELGVGHVDVELIPILNSFHGGAVQGQLAQILDESCGLTHFASNSRLSCALAAGLGFCRNPAVRS